MRFTIFKIAISFVVDGLGKLDAAILRISTLDQSKLSLKTWIFYPKSKPVLHITRVWDRNSVQPTSHSAERF